MARALRIQYPGALYHVTNRGNEWKSIFDNDDDSNQFINILTHSLDTYNISLHSFVLMHNHWHMLCETPLGNRGEFMRHFNIIYESVDLVDFPKSIHHIECAGDHGHTLYGGFGAQTDSKSTDSSIHPIIIVAITALVI